MITILGTVREMRGKPMRGPTTAATRPAVKAPSNAAASRGRPARSMSSRRAVLATAPMQAAAQAMEGVELKSTEKP